MKELLLIHKISEEIKDLENTNKKLLHSLKVVTFNNIMASICLRYKIDPINFRRTLGDKEYTTLRRLIFEQVERMGNLPTGNVGLSFEDDGSIYWWESITKQCIIKDLDDLKSKLN